MLKLLGLLALVGLVALAMSAESTARVAPWFDSAKDVWRSIGPGGKEEAQRDEPPASRPKSREAAPPALLDEPVVTTRFSESLRDGRLRPTETRPQGEPGSERSPAQAYHEAKAKLFEAMKALERDPHADR